MLSWLENYYWKKFFLNPEVSYYLIQRKDGQRGIQCATCGSRSYHPQDVEKAYCGKCHQFLNNNNFYKNAR